MRHSKRGGVVAIGNVSETDIRMICTEMEAREISPTIHRPDLSFLIFKDDFGKIIPYFKDAIEFCHDVLTEDELKYMGTRDKASYWLLDNNPDINAGSIFVVLYNSNDFRKGEDCEFVQMIRETFYTATVDFGSEYPLRDFYAELNDY